MSENVDVRCDWGAGPDYATGWYLEVSIARHVPLGRIYSIQLHTPWRTRLSLWWYKLKEQWKAEWRRPDGLS